MSYTVKQISLEDEYNKDTGITREDISSLRQWLSTQPHLPGEHITDLDLILTYHSCGCSSEVSKQVLDLHYTLRTLFANYFKNRVYNKQIENVLNKFLLTPLPTRTRDGYTVFYTHLIDTDPKSFLFNDIVRTILMITDMWQYEEGTWPGFVLIVDLESITIRHVSQLDLKDLRQYFYYLQEAMLVRFKGMHLLNAPSYVDKLMMIIKPFLKKCFLDLIYIHYTGTKTLDEFFPMDALPKEAGGRFKSFDECMEEVRKKIKSNSDFFVNESKKRVSEKLRAGKPKTISDIFGGVEGSFKKLDID